LVHKGAIIVMPQIKRVNVARILVIDDNEMVRDILSDLLEAEGHMVRTATEGRGGLALLAGFMADIVITDILMPGQEGIETIQELRANNPDTKIVAISGGGTRYGLSFLDMAEKLGAHATLSKPIDAKELNTLVERLLLPDGPGQPTPITQSSRASR